MSYSPKPSGNVVNYFSGSAITIHSKASGYWKSLSIINDGASDLTFTVNNLTITVKANETFTDDFVDFSSISIDTAIAYRLVLRE